MKGGEGGWSIYPQSRRCFSRDIRDTRSPPAGVAVREKAGSLAGGGGRGWFLGP